jgi:hypothetical protein
VLHGDGGGKAPTLAHAVHGRARAAEGQIQGVSSIVNPDKLRHLGPLADLGALRRERS